MVIREHFDTVFSEDCYLGNSSIEGSRLAICVRNIGVAEGHPLHKRQPHSAILYFETGRLIFEGVGASSREIYVYEVNPQINGFKPKRLIEDGPFPAVSGPNRTFRFLGVLDSPSAFADWTVVAQSFSLEIPYLS
jgi:hypothetical protein